MNNLAHINTAGTQRQCGTEVQKPAQLFLLVLRRSIKLMKLKLFSETQSSFLTAADKTSMSFQFWSFRPNVGVFSCHRWLNSASFRERWGLRHQVTFRHPRGRQCRRFTSRLCSNVTMLKAPELLLNGLVVKSLVRSCFQGEVWTFNNSFQTNEAQSR